MYKTLGTTKQHALLDHFRQSFPSTDHQITGCTSLGVCNSTGLQEHAAFAARQRSIAKACQMRFKPACQPCSLDYTGHHLQNSGKLTELPAQELIDLMDKLHTQRRDSATQHAHTRNQLKKLRTGHAVCLERQESDGSLLQVYKLFCERGRASWLYTAAELEQCVRTQ